MMEYRIRYTPEALNDMDEIWDGIFEISKSADIADRYMRELIAEIKNKKMFPMSGIPLNYRGLFTGFYSVNYKKYKAFYRIREQYIEVLRIIMAKRDYMLILFGESDEPEEYHYDEMFSRLKTYDAIMAGKNAGR